MTSDGGGWTLVQKASANFIPSTWSTTSAAIQTNYLTNAGFSDGTGKWADSDINSRVTVGYRLSGYYNGATPVRYVKPTCKYSQLSQPTGDCAVTYASLSWNSPLTCSAGNAAFRLGICDFAASGTFFYTADTRGGASSWFVGNDSGPSSYGGASNTSYAMFVK
jgi:hypothetical protein